MFRKLLQRDEWNPMVLYSLGNELFKEGSHAEARDHLKRAVEQKAGLFGRLQNLGRAHFELGEDAEALRVFERARVPRRTATSRRPRRSTSSGGAW
jgi:uncharacterized protein HemY